LKNNLFLRQKLTLTTTATKVESGGKTGLLICLPTSLVRAHLAKRE